MIWIAATIDVLLMLDLEEQFTSVPFNPSTTLVMSRVDTRGRAPKAEYLETLNEILIGGYDSTIKLDIISDVCVTILDPKLTPFSISGIVTVHFKFVALTTHLNNNCSPGQVDTVTVSRSRFNVIILLFSSSAPACMPSKYFLNIIAVVL